MICLGLDLSKRQTGWAVDGDNTCPPRASSWHSSAMTLGAIGLNFQEWLYDFIGINKVNFIAYEAPLMGNSDKPKEEGGFVMNEETTIVLIGLAFATEIVAASRMIPVRRAHVQTCRKLFVGHGRPEDPKQVVMNKCKSLGWPAPNTDATDAIAVWHWAKTTFDKTYRLEAATPLFGEARV